MRTRTAKTGVAALGAALALALAACGPTDNGTPTDTASPTPTANATTASTGTGPFRLPASACDLVDQATVEKLAGRSSVTLLSAGDAKTSATHKLLTCTFTSGIVPVGVLTIDVRPVDAGKNATQELADSIAGSLYHSSTTDDVPNLGDAAKYGAAPSIGGLTYATVWTVRLASGQVLGLSLTIGSHNADANKAQLIALTRTILTKL
jgi:hypothetical protein